LGNRREEKRKRKSGLEKEARDQSKIESDLKISKEENGINNKK